MKGKMLIVDDIQMNRDILKSLFKEEFDFFETDNGADALKIVSENGENIEIVLLDLFMDGMDGFEVLEKRQHMPVFQNIPVVVITSSEPVRDQVKAFDLGANEYVIKPLQPKMVHIRVMNVLKLHKQMQAAKSEAAMLKMKSEIDEMTGLLNKTTTEYYMNNILRNSQGCLNAMLVVDIDKFKSINDTFGHQTGDLVIKNIAKMLESSFRKSDIVGRIGGDEFCILMVGLPNVDLARKKVNQILHMVQYSPSNLIPEYASLSIGVATNDRNSTSYQKVFEKADEALYLAKESGRAQYREYGVKVEETESIMHELDLLSSKSAYDKSHNGHAYRVKTTVLLVEDHEINRKIIKKVLQSHYDVIEAQDGIEAMKVIGSKSDISVILLDIIMPRMDGYEVLIKLKETNKGNIPVIVLTGESDKNAEEKALDLGAIDFITKPIIPKILLSRVRNAVIRNQALMLERLRKKSELDDLTGLYNRATLFYNVKKMISQNKDEKFAFVRFDIDQFRLYNSAMGESEGDKLLQFIASSLPRMAMDFSVCTYGRVDADVFCMCVPYNKDILIKHADTAQNEMTNYRDDYSLSVSFGVYVIENKNESVEAMFTKASMAADRCKNQYDKNIAFFEESMEKKAKEEQGITNRMAAALADRQFVVYLQPKYDLDAQAPCGAEALVRWFDPVEGMISPGKFISVFERNGFIARLDYYMWEEVCKLIHKWKENGDTMYPISVNISRVSMYNVHLPELLEELITRYDIDVKYLQLEITESAYMSNPELMKEIIQKLHKIGFSILMDDFGSGYSSLNTLAEIDVDILKIDMKFMPQTMKEQKRAKILSAVIRMAGWIGMPVIAEGVETKEQRDYLESIGCGYVQGYFYAKPMPVKKYEELVRGEKRVKKEKLFVDSSIDVVWAPGPEVENLLKGISMPVGIYECADSDVEIIRANNSYMREFNLWKRTETIQSLGYGNYETIKAAILEAAKVDETIERRFKCENSAGKERWYRLKLVKMGSIPKASIVCGMFCDITDEINYEMQLQRIERFYGTKNRKKLLVIDDSEVSRGVIHGMFKDQYEILEAENGIEGLELLKTHADSIAIVLLDMIMPKLDGEGFLKEKSKIESAEGIPVVVISAEEAIHAQIKMLQLGVNDYITKPFEPELVEERVRNVVSYNSRFQKLVSEYKNK